MDEQLKSVKKKVTAMRYMLRGIESELERLIAAAARGQNRAKKADEVGAIAERVIQCLNQWSGRCYRTDKPQSVELIKTLLAEGWEEEDLLLVIKQKVDEWKGTDFEKYIRPETLFGDRFESYLMDAKREGTGLNEMLLQLYVERVQGQK